MNSGSRVNAYQSIPYSRKKKIEIFTQNKLPIRRQPYQEANPYALTRNPSTPFLQNNRNGNFYNDDQESSNRGDRDTLTETSSQKSGGKVVRANGLRKAEKPNLGGSKASESSSNSHNFPSKTARKLNLSNYRQEATQAPHPNHVRVNT